ncbi:MAG: hypothetical protein ACO1RX_08915 [Candidatus Sericytochromatia bacterium]
MNISKPLSHVFQRLDTNRNGVSVGELKQAAGGDFNLSQTEGEALGLTDAQDVGVINQALQRAQTGQLDSRDILFPPQGAQAEGPQPPPGFAGREMLTREGSAMTQLAFASDTPDVGTRLERLNFALMHPRSQALDGSFKLVQRNPAQTQIDLAALDGVQNTEQIRANTLTSLGASEADPAGYLQNNYSAVAAGLGDDLSDRYNGHVKFTGDADAVTAFQTPGADDIVVCTDIHASLTAWHNANGNEAYTVSTSSNDAAHVFTVFKDPKTEKWNIQNYGTVVETDARDVKDLYDRYMPDQRNIRFYSVNAQGELQQERKVKTATGLREWDFRNNLGAGNYDPTTAKQGVDLGTSGLSATFGGFNLNFNPQNTTLGLNYHTRSQNGNTEVIQGVGAELQDHTANGFTTRRADVKYERRSTEFETHSPNHLEQTSHHVSAFAGVEQAPGDPIYWRDTNDGATPVGGNDTGVRFGGQYNHVNRHYFRLGESNQFFLTGHQESIGLTGTLSATGKGADVYETYAGRMLNDITAEVRVPVGLARITPTTFVQGGVMLGLNAAHFDGVKDPGEQVGNMLEADAFVEGRWKPDPRVSLVGMGNVDLKHSTGGEFIGRFGAGAEMQLTPQLSWTTMGLLDLDTQLGHRGGVQTGVNYAPSQRVSMGVTTGVAMDGRPTVNGGLRVNF